MSLFEKLNNKRYDLQEAIDDKGNLFGNNSGKKKKYTPPSKEKSDAIQSRSANRDAKKYASGEYAKIGGGERMTPKSKGPGASTGGTKISPATIGGKSKGTTPVKVNITKPVKQSGGANTGTPVKKTPPKITGTVDSKKAEIYTKKINAANPKRPEYVKKDVYKGAEKITNKINPKQSRPLGQLVKKTKPSKTSVSGKLTPGQIDFSKSAELASKRKARINPKTGKATQAGVKDFAMNRGGFGRMSGNMSKSDFKKMVTGDPKKAASFKKIVTDAERIVKNPKGDEYKKIANKINTSDYAGKEARKRPAGSKTFAQVKREIDAKEKAYQTKTLPKQKQLAKTNLINPQRRSAAIKKVGSQNVAFKQTATKAASYLPGGKSKVAKKAIQIASKLGPAGRIAAATGLVLLNPGVRKLARNIGKGAVSSFTGGGSKTPVKQTTGRLGINLSPGSPSSSPSKFALKRQELLKKSPNKVPNKNLA